MKLIDNLNPLGKRILLFVVWSAILGLLFLTRNTIIY